MQRSCVFLITSLALLIDWNARADQVSCGYVAVQWSVPNGGLVFNRGSGVVSDVLTSLGESRTHTMLSHGANGYVSHATAREPPQQGWPAVCSVPLDPGELRDGYPGLEQIDSAALFKFLFGSGNLSQLGTPGARTAWLGWQLGYATNAAATADYVWYNVPFYTDTSRATGESGYDPYSFNDIYRPAPFGPRTPYLLNQFRNIANVNWGAPWNNEADAGMVCSTFAAWANRAAGQTAPGYTVVAAETYSHDQLVTAANTLYWSVYNQCSGEPGGFWIQLGRGLACPFIDVCANAANQVVNCMANPDWCSSSDPSLWHGIVNNTSTTASTISPDWIGGWPLQRSHSSWEYDWNRAVTWNSIGSVYGCWY